MQNHHVTANTTLPPLRICISSTFAQQFPFQIPFEFSTTCFHRCGRLIEKATSDKRLTSGHTSIPPTSIFTSLDINDLDEIDYFLMEGFLHPSVYLNRSSMKSGQINQGDKNDSHDDGDIGLQAILTRMARRRQPQPRSNKSQNIPNDTHTGNLPQVESAVDNTSTPLIAKKKRRNIAPQRDIYSTPHHKQYMLNTYAPLPSPFSQAYLYSLRVILFAINCFSRLHSGRSSIILKSYLILMYLHRHFDKNFHRFCLIPPPQVLLNQVSDQSNNSDIITELKQSLLHCDKQNQVTVQQTNIVHLWLSHAHTHVYNMLQHSMLYSIQQCYGYWLQHLYSSLPTFLRSKYSPTTHFAKKNNITVCINQYKARMLLLDTYNKNGPENKKYQTIVELPQYLYDYEVDSAFYLTYLFTAYESYQNLMIKSDRETKDQKEESHETKQNMDENTETNQDVLSLVNQQILKKILPVFLQFPHHRVIFHHNTVEIMPLYTTRNKTSKNDINTMMMMNPHSSAQLQSNEYRYIHYYSQFLPQSEFCENFAHFHSNFSTGSHLNYNHRECDHYSYKHFNDTNHSLISPSLSHRLSVLGSYCLGLHQEEYFKHMRNIFLPHEHTNVLLIDLFNTNNIIEEFENCQQKVRLDQDDENYTYAVQQNNIASDIYEYWVREFTNSLDIVSQTPYGQLDFIYSNIFLESSNATYDNNGDDYNVADQKISHETGLQHGIDQHNTDNSESDFELEFEDDEDDPLFGYSQGSLTHNNNDHNNNHYQQKQQNENYLVQNKYQVCDFLTLNITLFNPQFLHACYQIFPSSQNIRLNIDYSRTNHIVAGMDEEEQRNERQRLLLEQVDDTQVNDHFRKLFESSLVQTIQWSSIPPQKSIYVNQNWERPRDNLTQEQIENIQPLHEDHSENANNEPLIVVDLDFQCTFHSIMLLLSHITSLSYLISLSYHDLGCLPKEYLSEIPKDTTPTTSKKNKTQISHNESNIMTLFDGYGVDMFMLEKAILFHRLKALQHASIHNNTTNEITLITAQQLQHQRMKELSRLASIRLNAQVVAPKSKFFHSLKSVQPEYNLKDTQLWYSAIEMCCDQYYIKEVVGNKETPQVDPLRAPFVGIPLPLPPPIQSAKFMASIYPLFLLSLHNSTRSNYSNSHLSANITPTSHHVYQHYISGIYYYLVYINQYQKVKCWYCNLSPISATPISAQSQHGEDSFLMKNDPTHETISKPSALGQQKDMKGPELITTSVLNEKDLKDIIFPSVLSLLSEKTKISLKTHIKQVMDGFNTLNTSYKTTISENAAVILSNIKSLSQLYDYIMLKYNEKNCPRELNFDDPNHKDYFATVAIEEEKQLRKPQNHKENPFDTMEFYDDFVRLETGIVTNRENLFVLQNDVNTLIHDYCQVYSRKLSTFINFLNQHNNNRSTNTASHPYNPTEIAKTNNQIAYLSTQRDKIESLENEFSNMLDTVVNQYNDIQNKFNGIHDLYSEYLSIKQKQLDLQKRQLLPPQREQHQSFGIRAANLSVLGLSLESQTIERSDNIENNVDKIKQFHDDVLKDISTNSSILKVTNNTDHGHDPNSLENQSKTDTDQRQPTNAYGEIPTTKQSFVRGPMAFMSRKKQKELEYDALDDAYQ